MKKLTAAVISLLLLTAFPIAALADGTTTLTTTVADASYTLNIPANQTIEYGATQTKIGTIKVDDASGFAVGKNLQVTATYGDFTSNTATTTIPIGLFIGEGQVDSNHPLNKKIGSGSYIVFPGEQSGTVRSWPDFDNQSSGTTLWLCIESTDWGKAENGTYTTTITFTSQVVSE